MMLRGRFCSACASVLRETPLLFPPVWQLPRENRNIPREGGILLKQYIVNSRKGYGSRWRHPKVIGPEVSQHCGTCICWKTRWQWKCYRSTVSLMAKLSSTWAKWAWYAPRQGTQTISLPWKGIAKVVSKARGIAIGVASRQHGIHPMASGMP